MIGGLGATELIIILIIVIVIFGGKRLPELGRGIGEAMKNFKKSVSHDEIDVSPSRDKVEEKKVEEKKEENDEGKTV
ncbi:MAG: twin-arginine translocase TatA/TatE family subunit [Thermodesulfobacteriota bacterium]